MENRRFVALGDLIADCYYNGKKLLRVDGGSSRYNVIANLSYMNCRSAVIGGCGNDKIGETMIKRLTNMEVDTSKILLRNRASRAYHLIINQETLPYITYKCSKNSPQNGESTWYEDSLEDLPYCYNEVRNTDVIILDMLDEFSLAIIGKFKSDKILDIGNINQISRLQDGEILALGNKIEILQLNQSVIPYLMQRFGCTNILNIYNLFQPEFMIVTRGKDGADFVFYNKLYSKKIINSAKELDATGAGDAFLSVFVKKYYDNSKKVDDEFIDSTFKDATSLTSEVVQNVGARGHLYEKKLDRFVQKSRPNTIMNAENRDGFYKKEEAPIER